MTTGSEKRPRAEIELDDLLSTDLAFKRLEEVQAFDRVCQGRPVVLFGAGGLGRRVLAGLRQHGVVPVAFADNNAEKQGSVVDGVRVLSPSAAAVKFRKTAAFVVTIWGANSPHRFAHSREQLTSLGCDVVCPFPPLLWKYADSLLPYYLQDLPSKVLAARTDVRQALDLWEDEDSRSEYVAQVRLRVAADFDGLAHPVGHKQYFPNDLFLWRDDEWVVDGGAYDGDTIRAISELYGAAFDHVLAIEPDPRSFRRLEECVEVLSGPARMKVVCRQLAFGSTATTLFLDPTGTASSNTSVVETPGAVEVPAVPIDQLLASEEPTFIKLDIEGAELDALKGARETIRRCAPVLAVCVYHRQDHLWTIPTLLREYRDDYALFLRPHNEEGWDLVCYAIPRKRLR